MKILKIDILEVLTASLALSGAMAVMIGVTACLGGLGGVSTIQLGKLLNPHRHTLHKMMFFGGASVGAGLFSIGTGVSIARGIGERRAEVELMRFEAEVRDSCPKPATCVGCKHFHGVIYNDTQLICGMHPYGCEGDQCPDWESIKNS
ncbi:MAG: hypothetical protein DSM106950_34840 [Stigonema ocellatum SAG 48.90 = DSM 106950]|nr:hypothetical protein [Stigonema ocellatum SAG 48.90 = DSM 106950]